MTGNCRTQYNGVTGASKNFETGLFWREMVSAFHRCMLEVSRTNTFSTLKKSRTEILAVSDGHLPFTIQRGDRCFKIFWNQSIQTWNGLRFPSVYVRSVYDKYFYHNQQKIGCKTFCKSNYMEVHCVFHTKYKGVNGALKFFETGVFRREMTSALHLCVLKMSRTNTFFTLNKSWRDILTGSDR